MEARLVALQRDGIPGVATERDRVAGDDWSARCSLAAGNRRWPRARTARESAEASFKGLGRMGQRTPAALSGRTTGSDSSARATAAVSSSEDDHPDRRVDRQGMPPTITRLGTLADLTLGGAGIFGGLDAQPRPSLT